jgi:hypothetical protein
VALRLLVTVRRDLSSAPAPNAFAITFGARLRWAHGVGSWRQLGATVLAGRIGILPDDIFNPSGPNWSRAIPCNGGGLFPLPDAIADTLIDESQPLIDRLSEFCGREEHSARSGLPQIPRPSR